MNDAYSVRNVDARHAPAVAMGLFPAIAAWGATVVEGAFRVSGGQTLSQVLLANSSTEANGFLVQGLISMERGSIFTCMILAAISAFLIDRKFYSAALWSILAACCTTLGLMHAFQVEGNSINYLFNLTLPLVQTPPAPPEGVYYYRALTVAVGYLLAAGAFAWCGWHQSRHPVAEGAGH